MISVSPDVIVMVKYVPPHKWYGIVLIVIYVIYIRAIYVTMDDGDEYVIIRIQDKQ